MRPDSAKRELELNTDHYLKYEVYFHSQMQNPVPAHQCVLAELSMYALWEHTEHIAPFYFHQTPKKWVVDIWKILLKILFSVVVCGKGGAAGSMNI